MTTTKQSGFHVIEVVLIIAVIVLLGFVGFKVIDSRKTKNDATQTSTGTTASQASEIKTTNDLTNASKAVDEVSADDDLGDMTKLEQELDSL